MKEQSARIAEEKIQELWKFFPALKNEIIDQRGAKNTTDKQLVYLRHQSRTATRKKRIYAMVKHIE